MVVDACNASAAAPAIAVRELTKRFRRATALDHVTLAVPRGCAFGLLGPNGAGKTTLIKLLLGLQRPSGGSITVLGYGVPDAAHAALGRVGAVIEEPRFHGYLSARENLLVAAAWRSSAAVGRTEECLARVELAEHADDPVRRFSLGMRQRLGIARALLADPELLILDEPTNGLDPAGIRDLRLLLRSFVAEGRTVFLSSHLITEVERVSDLIAILDRGRVITSGSIAEVVAGSTLEERFLELTGAHAAA